MWSIIRPLHFKFLSSVQSVTTENGGDLVGSVRIVKYSDGTVQKYRVLECSDLHEFITYEIFESVPAVSVTSAQHTIRLRPITHDNSTLIEWSSTFSNDASAEVLQDSRYKKKEGLGELVKFLAQ